MLPRLRTRTVSPVYRTASGWNAILPDRPSRCELPERPRVAAIVIGAGYTGLAAARRLVELRPDDEVLLIESSTVGEGSSGRNAGMIVSVPHNLPMSGPTSGGARPPQLDIYASGMTWLQDLVRYSDIRCDWNAADKYYAAATPDGERALAAMMTRYGSWGVAYRKLGPDDLRARVGTSYYRSGFSSGQNVFVQPAALVRGLADALPSRVRLLENTAVEAVSGSGPYTVRTTRGTFESATVLLANNGFAKSLGFLRDRMVTIFTYAGLTPVLPEPMLSQLGDGSEWGILPAHRLGTTLRRTGDGRMLVRSAYSYERERPIHEVEALLRSLYQARFPGLGTYEFEHVWGGVTALTRNGAAFLGRLGPGLYAAAGCNGSGILKGSMNGKLLAEMALGHASPDLEAARMSDGPNWLPPEPVRRIGVQAAIRYQTYRAGAER